MRLPILESLEERRLLASPEADLTFGEGGVARVTNSWGDLNIIKELPDGKILVAGSANSFTAIAGFSDDPIVARSPYSTRVPALPGMCSRASSNPILPPRP